MGGGRDVPVGFPWSDLQQYYLDARKADRQQNENMKTTQGILEAITQSTRFVTAEIWLVHGAAFNKTAHGVGGGSSGFNKVAPGDPDGNGGDIETGESFGMHLKFSGNRATCASFLANAAAKGTKAQENYEKLEKIYDHYQPHVGEGLQVALFSAAAAAACVLT